ncbi:MAG: filamentous hemagglutinin N-terminal domain-containing protein [Okeania sp. SIO3I5]|uniref:two-partner secretion domain-containing protein n=1 Tax=Okeania sp. SIO3I5 TaxID=2607805 RepID=UPI0013B770D0|nr:filamentous hemagglutinin N-terminal domain-containing protein [Okeania sp. SIO3I5]NEQ39701.1 filamentous hemagglutinin N-terminal domain-containing protein [Okeania sp. SIO3I5]
MKLKSLLTQVSFSSGIWLILITLWSQKPVNSQIIPDQTLGEENTRIRNIDQLKKQIEGGAIRGANLFHSLQEFNILENHSVYFTNPAGIENILTRITGNNASNILGKLGVDGAANLFLINPNGIFFGPNATLDISGSFLATTADEIRLGENGLFSATNPQNNNLLSVAPSALFFNQIANQTGNIINTATETGLEISRKETLGLIGNQVIIDGGKLTAEQGRIEIGSVGSNSLIEIEPRENNYVLNYAEVENFNNIEVKNNAVVDVSGEGSGEIQIQGKQIVIQERARILADTLGTESGGNISLTASESIEVNDSLVNADVGIGATGNGANITINTPGLTLTNRGQISTGTFGAGASGALTVNAEQIEIIGASPDGQNLSGLFTSVFPGATGRGGDVTINTQSLKLLTGGQLGANVLGEAEGGNITVNAKEIEANGTIQVDSPILQQELLQALNGQFPSGILAVVLPQTTGNSGKLTVNSDRVILKNGAQIGTATLGSGNSGELAIKAAEIEAVGTSPDGLLPSSFFTSVLVGGTGEGGNINIETQSLTLENGGQIRAGTSGVGNSGNIRVKAKEINLRGSSADGRLASSIQAPVEDLLEIVPEALGSFEGGQVLIETERLSMENGATVRATTFGEEQGGSIEIKANDIDVDNSIISADSNNNNIDIITIGDGGNLTINTQRMSLKNGGRLLAVTSGASQGGNITINATEMEASGISPDGSFPSGIDTRVQQGATANGGNLTINTQRLIQTDGASIQAGVLSSGQGGDVTINAKEIELSGSAASTNLFPELSPLILSINGEISSSLLVTVLPGATGKGGNLTINTENLTVRDGGLIGTGTFGSGESGDVTVRATEINLIGTNPTGQLPSSVFTTVWSGGTGNGGNLTIDTERLYLRNGGQVRAGTSGLGKSGDLTIRAKDIEVSDRVFETTGLADNDGVGSGIFASVEDLTELSLGQGKGDGGNAFIQTERLTILDGAEVSVITEGEGKAGNLTINATDNITLSGVSNLTGNSSAINAGSESGATERGGNLNITTPTLNLSNGAVVTARSRSNSNGGNISLNVNHLNLASGAQILTSSFNDGNAGTIKINADSAITLSGRDLNFNDRVANFQEESIDTDGADTAIASRSRGNGNAGSVTINTPQLRVEDQSIITVSSSGSGVAGSLLINAPSIRLNNGTLSAETNAGEQGNITIQASEINLQNQSQITTNATNSATGGDLNIDTKFLIGSDNSNISGNALEGEGGNISISAEGVFLDNSSQITATSVLGVDGSVELNTQVDPTQGVVKLSATVINAESLVAQNLCAATTEEKQGSSFVITGRGGLPPDPTQPLTVLRGTVGWESNIQEDTKVVMSESQQPVVVYRRIDSQKLPQITQAMGWVMTESGKVTLTSTTNGVNSASPQLIHPSCYLFLGSRE